MLYVLGSFVRIIFLLFKGTDNDNDETSNLLLQLLEHGCYIIR